MRLITENTQAVAAATAMAIEGMRAELQAGLAQFIGSQRIDAARPVPAGGRALAQNGRCRLVGWSVRATAGDVVVNLHDGVDATGDVVASFALAAGQSTTVPLPAPGVSCPNGLYIARSGAGADGLVGSLYVGAVD